MFTTYITSRMPHLSNYHNTKRRPLCYIPSPTFSVASTQACCFTAGRDDKNTYNLLSSQCVLDTPIFQPPSQVGRPMS